MPVDPITIDLLRRWSLPLDEDGDKFERGTVLVVGGSDRTPGAVVLAGVAALRVGAGRLQLATPSSAESVAALSVAVPESAVVRLPSSSNGGPPDGEVAAASLADLDEAVAAASAVAVGPGLSADDATWLADRVLHAAGRDAIVVVDARALEALTAVDDDVLASIGGRVVLTPNRGECRSLAPDVDDDASDVERAQRIAARFDAVVTSHGVVATPTCSWQAGGGGPGLGTSGSGDVLAGFVAGFAARCGDAAQAACWGTYVHVAADRLLTGRVGRVGYLARELSAEAPLVVESVGDGPARASA